MWGVIPGGKEAVLTVLRANLKEMGEDGISIPERQNSTYTMFTDSLLAKLGTARVITEIVAGQVRRQFADRPGALDFLRAHWLSGTLPRWQTLQTLRLPRTVKERFLEAAHPSEPLPMRKQTADILDAFLEVNPQYKYVHGWTVFAGLWFEEIEPLLKVGVEKRTG